MEWLILAMLIGGTAMTAYGQYQTGRTQKKMGRLQRNCFPV